MLFEITFKQYVDVIYKWKYTCRHTGFPYKPMLDHVISFELFESFIRRRSRRLPSAVGYTESQL